MPNCTRLEHKASFAADLPFQGLKVRLNREIITMRLPDVDPEARVGTYVEPEDWNTLILDTNTIVIDTRNDF